MNSKSEFNCCHIPWLVVEKEDKEKKKLRMEQEQKNKMKMDRLLLDMDLSWEERKTRIQELAEKKWRRGSDIEDIGGGGRAKRRKKINYSLLEEGWVEDLVEDKYTLGNNLSVH